VTLVLLVTADTEPCSSRAVRRALVLALVLAAAACRPHADAPAADAGAAEPPWDGITLDLTPDPDREEVLVAVRVSAARSGRVREVRVARAWADTRGARAVLGPHVVDEAGEILLAPRRDDGGPDDVYDLARPPRGELLLRHRAASSAGRSRFALRVAADRMSGVGHAFLLLPRIDESTPTRVRIHADRLGRGADAASSFGLGGEVVTTATSEELAHAVYVAGALWRETGGPQHEELVVLGGPPFDTRTAFDRAVAARGAVDDFFGVVTSPDASPDAAPIRFLLVAQRGLGSAHDGAALTRSLGLWFDADQRLDGELQLVLAHELAHRFLGGAVRLVDADGREALWFAEGFTVHAARRAMLDAGLVDPRAFVADVNRAIDDGEGPPGAEILPPEYRRGALGAAYLDAAVRRASAGRRSLREVLRELVARGGTLPTSALGDALARDLGEDGKAAVKRLAARDGAPFALPDDAFGPCARRRTGERGTFELGFDPRALATTPTVVRGLVAGSAAARAGLHDGDLVLRARVPPAPREVETAAPEPVELLLANGSVVRYKPTATRRETRWEAAPCALTPRNR
jgi:hypothetical protein